jgi:integrase
MAKITKRTVDALKPGEIAWDSEIKGFGARCQRKAKTYVLKYRAGTRQRWLTIGRHGSPWTVERARSEAKHLLGMIADRKDPAAFRDTLKDRPSVKDLCERFLAEYAAEHKKASSLHNDQINIRNHVLPLLGKLNVADVSRADIDGFKRAVKDGKTARDVRTGPQGRSVVTGGPGVANKCLALLSKMFNMAERWGWRADDSNPCRHVDRYKGRKPERFLSERELAGLSEALAEAERDGTEGPYAVAAIRLLVLTGARLGEILNLEWSHVDFERAMLFLPDSKTGAKVVYLSAPVLEVLSNVPRLANNPYVICGDKAGAALVNAQKPWRRIRRRAGLENVRLHDLRHSFASVAASGGLSLPVIGKLLGHAQAATTERYAHLAADPIRAANEAIGQRIAAMMNCSGESAEIVSMPKRGA